MVTNRFDRFTNRDYNMEWYAPKEFTPNFEAWDSLLSRQQQQYDAALAATQKYPKHLQNRSDLASQYRNDIETNVNAITNNFLNEGINSGNRKLRDFAFKLNKDWQAGGLAYELEQEYNEYQNALGTIDKYYKDAKAENSANKFYSLDRLKRATENEFGLDETTGMYKRTPINAETYPYVDIAEEAQKIVKEIKDTGRTDIIKMSPAWFQKIQTEEVTPETIKEVTNALMQQPKYGEQRAIELWREKSKYTPEQLAELELSYKQGQLNNFQKSKAELSKALSTSDGAKQIQTMLQDEGYYDGGITGKADAKTKQAYEMYLKDKEDSLTKQLDKVSADTILNDKILNTYTQPLIEAYSYKKVTKDLIFNKEWETRMKISAQRDQTNKLITAIQSLVPKEQSEFSVTPGLARPLETIDELKKNYQQTYESSKTAFNDIAGLSGLTKIIGNSSPNQIHAITNARLMSKTPEEFALNLSALGIGSDKVESLWDFYNSPDAENLQNSYMSMHQAKTDLDNAKSAEHNLYDTYFKSPEGKSELQKLKKSYGLKDKSDDDVINMISNNDSRLSFETPINVSSGGFGQVSLRDLKKTNIADSIKGKINDWAKSNPTAFPSSLRGHAFNSIKGSGELLEKNIVDDLKSGYTLGYNTNNKSGVKFKTIEQTGKGTEVDLSEVDLKNAELRFNVDSKGVQYYITAQTIDGKKPVSVVLDAPAEHADRLRNLAVEMKRQAFETNDNSLDAMANKLYDVSANGPKMNYAVEDAIEVTNRTGTRLYNVIDPNASTSQNIKTFGNNENIIGLPVGTEKEVNGLIYQKFKVKNPKTNKSGFLMTVKTNAGYSPIPNKSGGLWYDSASEAESPIINSTMMRQIPVEINTSKLDVPNVTPAQAAGLLNITGYQTNDE